MKYQNPIFHNQPPIPWLDKIIADDQPDRPWIVRAVLDALCDPFVSVGEPYGKPVDLATLVPIRDAEGDLVCMVPPDKADLMLRLLNEATLSDY